MQERISSKLIKRNEPTNKSDSSVNSYSKKETEYVRTQ